MMAARQQLHGLVEGQKGHSYRAYRAGMLSTVMCRNEYRSASGYQQICGVCPCEGTTMNLPFSSNNIEHWKHWTNFVSQFILGKCSDSTNQSCR